jgi:hypothetical protein
MLGRTATFPCQGLCSFPWQHGSEADGCDSASGWTSQHAQPQLVYSQEKCLHFVFL